MELNPLYTCIESGEGLSLVKQQPCMETLVATDWGTFKVICMSRGSVLPVSNIF